MRCWRLVRLSAVAPGAWPGLCAGVPLVGPFTSTHVYKHIYISRNIGGQGLRTRTRAISWDRGVPCFDFGGLFKEKSVRSRASCDGPQLAGLNTATESFWRCLFVEIWSFLWSDGVPLMGRSTSTYVYKHIYIYFYIYIYVCQGT